MKKLEIQVSDDTMRRIETAAHRRGVSSEELVRISVEEKLARHDELEEASRHVLAKNAALYERLSGK